MIMVPFFLGRFFHISLPTEKNMKVEHSKSNPKGGMTR
jgi:hypothetical protein